MKAIPGREGTGCSSLELASLFLSSGLIQPDSGSYLSIAEQGVCQPDVMPLSLQTDLWLGRHGGLFGLGIKILPFSQRLTRFKRSQLARNGC
eukprot:2056881-Rhodomonas_salina.1